MREFWREVWLLLLFGLTTTAVVVGVAIPVGLFLEGRPAWAIALGVFLAVVVLSSAMLAAVYFVVEWAERKGWK